MAQILLHIGAHKTGTSFLQRTLEANRRKLAEAEIHYPDLGPNAGHHILVAPWIDVPEIPAHYFGKGGPNGLWDRVVQTGAERNGTLILSAEPFSRGAPQRVNMADLAERLSTFEDVRVLYVARRQPEFLQSLWLQVAKTAARPPAFDNFVANALASGMASGVWLDHAAVLDHVLQGFRPAQVTVWDYDTVREAPGGLLRAFLALADAPELAAELEPVEARQANVSPDPLGFYAAARITRPMRPAPDLVASATHALKARDHRRNTILTRKQYESVLDVFAPSNARLTRMVREFQPEFRFAPEDVRPALRYREELANPDWVRLARAVAKIGQ